MKIEKLPSGSYRIRQQYKGKRYTVVVDYKPTQKEALRLMADKMNADDRGTGTEKVDMHTFGEYCKKYIEYCEKSKYSPATVRGYLSIMRNISDGFMEIRLTDMTNRDVQAEIKLYGATHSAKSTKNLYGFIRSVMGKYRPDFTLAIKLPSGEQKAEYEPTTKDIQSIIEMSRGTRYHIPLQLAVLGLRRGEVCALTVDDLSDDNVLTINKDMVIDKDNNKVIKNRPKTEASNRRILLPSNLANEIREQGYIFRGNPHAINEYLHKCQDRLKIPRFRLHMLRHYCVAYLHKQGFTSEQIMSWGGWSSDSVMKRAYRYNLDPAESQARIAESLSGIF